GSWLGSPSASRGWRWTIEAPRSAQRRTSAATAAGVRGTYGESARVGTMPVGARLTISSSDIRSTPRPRRHADDGRPGRRVAPGDGPSSEGRPGADGHGIADDRPDAQVRAVTDRDLAGQVGARPDEAERSDGRVVPDEGSPVHDRAAPDPRPRADDDAR